MHLLDVPSVLESVVVALLLLWHQSFRYPQLILELLNIPAILWEVGWQIDHPTEQLTKQNPVVVTEVAPKLGVRISVGMKELYQIQPNLLSRSKWELMRVVYQRNNPKLSKEWESLTTD
jgi:hypothetical protein